MAEIAYALFPETGQASAYEIARRTVARLLEREEVIERRNGVATMSFVLSRRGCARLRDFGFDFRPGYELSSVNGGTFLHRSLTTAYLLHRMREGAHAIGEHSILAGHSGYSADEIKRRHKKLPDGLTIWRWPEVYDPEIEVVEWIETEMSLKSVDELDRVFRLENWLGLPLAGVKGTVIDRLTIVCDERSGHPRRLIHFAREFARRHVELYRERDPAFDSVFLALADVTPPLTVNGFKLRRFSELLGPSSR